MSARDVPDLAYGDPPDRWDLPHCGFRFRNLGPAGGFWTCTADLGHELPHVATGLNGSPVYATATSREPYEDD